jgi:uncharacterized protein (DUF924 family)
MDEARSVRDFWFGRLPLTADGLNRRILFWFGDESSALRQRRDEQLRVRFGALVERAEKGELAPWADGPRRRLSLILLLDQFPRNIYRGTARAFTGDSQALALALSGMQSGADAALTVAERIFFYMPLQHAESREVQEESVAAYRRLLAEAPEELHGPLKGAQRSAENHREIIERFGRFPHRNRVLGRPSTKEELEWLRTGGVSFGQ